MNDFILIIKNTEQKNIENKLISYSSFQLTFYWIHNLFKTRYRHFSRKCAGQLICREEMTQICSAYTETGFFFLWPLSIKNNIVLYHMDSAPLYHVDFPQLHLIGFHDIYYIAWSSGSYVSPTCPFLAGTLTKVLNWKVSSSTLGSSVQISVEEEAGRQLPVDYSLFSL